MMIDLRFAPSCEVSLPRELPGGPSVVLRFPPTAITDGLLVRVKRAGGERWTGSFVFGRSGSAALAAVVAMPDGVNLCVIAGRSGYVVSLDDPSHWEFLPLEPITDVRVIEEAGLVVFAGPAELVAWDRSGSRWRKHVAWDGMTLKANSATELSGEYDDYPNRRVAQFVVDLTSGQTRGGVDD